MLLLGARADQGEQGAGKEELSMTAWAVAHSCQQQHTQGILPVHSGGCHSYFWRTAGLS